MIYRGDVPIDMEIPAVFASCSGESLLASDAWFRGLSPDTRGRTVPFQDAVSRLPKSEERFPVVLADLDSLGGQEFREGVLKRMKVRGRDIWFMTWIETADDLFDAFNTNAEMVMGPLHAVLSDVDLADILSVSDSFIPVVYAVDGRAMVGGRRRPTVPEKLDELADIGFYRVCVLDTDGRVPGYDWERIADEHPSAIPFDNGNRTDGMGFGTVIRPLDLR